MILTILLLFLDSANSEINESSCLQQIKCSSAEHPKCVKIKRGIDTEFMLVHNPCEIKYATCFKKDLEATSVPLKDCGVFEDPHLLKKGKGKGVKGFQDQHSSTSSEKTDPDHLPGRHIFDDYRRTLYFLVDLSTNETSKLSLIVDAIKEVAEEAAKYRKAIFQLFTFPDFYEHEQTDNLHEFKDELDHLSPLPLEDCDKEILGAMKKVLKTHRRRRDLKNRHISPFLYVFTDGYAKDIHEADEITEKNKKTEMKITFVLTPSCYDRRCRARDSFEIFFKLAAENNGQVLRLRTDDRISQFPKYVEHTALEFDVHITQSELVNYATYLPLDIPDQVVYATISLSGSNVDFAILNPTFNRIMPEFVYNGAHTKVYQFVPIPPHTYSLKIDKSTYANGKLNVSLNIIHSKVDFTFEYLFSKKRRWREVEKIVERRKRREKYAETEIEEETPNPKYLIIKVNEPKNLIDVNKIKFIELHQKAREKGREIIFATHTLTMIDEEETDIFATEYKIRLPSVKQKCFLVASGILKGTVREVDSQERLYKPRKKRPNEETSSEETSSDSDDHNRKKKKTTPTTATTTTTEETTTRSTKSTRTFPTTDCTMWPESLKFKLTKMPWNAQSLSKWKQYRGDCPEKCPVRDVLVCARCQHGVHRTFMSDCHMRMYQCKHSEDKLILVSRKPCINSGPFLGEFARPDDNLQEPNDIDNVMSHVYGRLGS